MRYLLPFGLLCVAACSGKMEGAIRAGVEGGAGADDVTEASSSGGSSAGRGGAVSSTVPVAGGAVGQSGTSLEISLETLSEIIDRSCQISREETARLMPKVSVLLDDSQSMFVAPASGGPTPWQRAQDAIRSAIGPDVLRAFPPRSRIELRTFAGSGSPGGTGAAACVAPTAVVPFDYLDSATGLQAAAIEAAIESSVPTSRTPILDAYNATVQSLVDAPDWGTSDSYVLLVTDGYPSLGASCSDPCPSSENCARWWNDTGADSVYSDPAPIVDAIATAADTYHIYTILAQAGGDALGSWWMHEAATRGNSLQPGCDASTTNCLINLNGESLSSRLHDSWPRLHGSCVFPAMQSETDGSPADPSRVAVVIQSADGTFQILSQHTLNTPNCEVGFRMNSATELQLCERSCDVLNDVTNPAEIVMTLLCPVDDPRVPL